jgi:hypothetical protein
LPLEPLYQQRERVQGDNNGRTPQSHCHKKRDCDEEPRDLTANELGKPEKKPLAFEIP